MIDSCVEKFDEGFALVLNLREDMPLELLLLVTFVWWHFE